MCSGIKTELFTVEIFWRLQNYSSGLFAGKVCPWMCGKCCWSVFLQTSPHKRDTHQPGGCGCDTDQEIHLQSLRSC